MTDRPPAPDPVDWSQAEAGPEMDAVVARRLRDLAETIRVGGKIETPDVLVAAIELSAAFTAIVREEAEAIRAAEDTVEV